MAGGLTVEESRLDGFIAFMEERIAASDFARDGVVTDIDAELDTGEMSMALVDEMDALEPFGQGNPRPRFLVRGLRLDRVEIIKDAHLRLNLSAPRVLRPIKAMIFNGVGNVFGEQIRLCEGSLVDVVTTLKRNEWRGVVSLSLVIEDMRVASEQAADPTHGQDEEQPVIHDEKVEALELF